jgi:hypothetical protein
MKGKAMEVAIGPQGRDPRSVDSAFRKIALPTFKALPTPARRIILHALGKYAPWEDGFNPIAPLPGADDVTGAPDFVGIGVQKAGTTWWYDLVCQHPDVSRRGDIHKERHFFDRYATRSFGSEDCARYGDWFPRPAGRLTGEWTPDYIHFPWVPALLAQAAPQARLLVLLRDPIERFGSGLAHYRRDRGRLRTEIYADAVARGFYDEALRRWAPHFPPQQMLVLQYERCRADTAAQLARTYRFLGLEPFTPEGMKDRVNATTRSVDLNEDVRRRLREVYSPDMLELSVHFPDLDLELWPSFSDTGTR